MNTEAGLELPQGTSVYCCPRGLVLDLDNTVLKRQMAIISSMTAFEKRNPKVMNASRKKRVAQGSGTKVEEINRLLKMHLQMADMVKKMGQGKGLFGKMFGGGGAPDPAELERMQAELAKLDPNAIPPELRDMLPAGTGSAGKISFQPNDKKVEDCQGDTACF